MVNSPTIESPPSNTIKWILRLFHCLYVCLLPFAIYITLFSMIISDGPKETPLTIIIFMLTISTLPLSIWLSIRLMWSKYAKNQPTQALIAAGLPFYTLAAIPVLLGLLNWLARFTSSLV